MHDGVQDIDLFRRGFWEWKAGGYEAGFPRGCGFSDIDGMCEIDGRFLFVEGKFWSGDGDLPILPNGQRQALQRLACYRNVSVLAIYGHAGSNNPLGASDMCDGRSIDWRDRPIHARRLALKRAIDRRLLR